MTKLVGINCKVRACRDPLTNPEHFFAFYRLDDGVWRQDYDSMGQPNLYPNRADALNGASILLLDALVNCIKLAGFAVLFHEYCECGRTPGFPGQIRGVTERELGQVRIGLKANPTIADKIEVLAHELKHVREPDWDCGSVAPWKGARI